MDEEKENVAAVPLAPLQQPASGPPNSLLYQQLYHASVERNDCLQAQLTKYSHLLSKHRKITELKVCVYTMESLSSLS